MEIEQSIQFHAPVARHGVLFDVLFLNGITMYRPGEWATFPAKVAEGIVRKCKGQAQYCDEHGKPTGSRPVDIMCREPNPGAIKAVRPAETISEIVATAVGAVLAGLGLDKSTLREVLARAGKQP